jgi:cellulose biosynthesis protein BcsQ
MKCLIITNNKGGTSKTTLAVHSLWWIANALKKKVLLIDLDEEQGGNAIRWCLAHKIRKPETGNIYQSVWGGHCVYLPNSIPVNYDLVIVDTRPSATQLVMLEEYVTHILVPFKGRFGREGLEDIIATIKDLQWDGKVPMRAIPVMTDTTIQSQRDIEMAKKIGIPLMSAIKYFPFVDRALEEGVPIWKTPWGIRSTLYERLKEIAEWVKP